MIHANIRYIVGDYSPSIDKMNEAGFCKSHLVSTSVTVVGGRENGHDVAIVGPVVAFHHQLVSPEHTHNFTTRKLSIPRQTHHKLGLYRISGNRIISGRITLKTGYPVSGK